MKTRLRPKHTASYTLFSPLMTFPTNRENLWSNYLKTAGVDPGVSNGKGAQIYSKSQARSSLWPGSRTRFLKGSRKLGCYVLYHTICRSEPYFKAFWYKNGMGKNVDQNLCERLLCLRLDPPLTLHQTNPPSVPSIYPFEQASSENVMSLLVMSRTPRDDNEKMQKFRI